MVETAPVGIIGFMRNVFSCTVRKWLDDNASATGAALAFYCAFSLAPLLIIILALAGWIVGEEAAFGFVKAQLHLLFGNATAALVVDAIRESHRTEGVTAAIISVGTLLIGATSVFAALEQALEKILENPLPVRSGLRRWLRTRLLSFGFILALSFLLLVSLTVSTGIAGLRSWATNRYSSLLVTIGVLDFVVSIALTTTLFAVIYRYMTTRRLPWRLVASGGLLTAILFALGKWAIGLYLAKSTVPTAFGAAASFAALLLWLYYTAQIFLLGAEFTACLGRTGKADRMG
jgi:membrane protein